MGFDRGIEGVGAEDRVGDAAVRVLRGRLDAVRGDLARVAPGEEPDAEDVHQLRVATRRARAALQLFADVLPGRRRERVERRLRRLRRAAGAARDCDVLLARLEAHPRPDRARRRFRKAVRRDRTEARRRLAKVAGKMIRDDRFGRRAEALIRRAARPRPARAATAARRLGDWAPGRLRPLVDRFLDAAPTPGAGVAELHRFRIRGKALRYAMEVVAPAFPAGPFAELYGMIERLVDGLGRVNDRAQAVARLSRRAKTGGDRRLLAQEQARLDRAVAGFVRGGNASILQDLRDGFDRLLGRTADVRPRRAASVDP